MKATGIVRRIDDLERVVVPKEIRRVLRIREGDPLEIYTGTTGEVILKKYSPISELGRIAEGFAESASSILGLPVLVLRHGSLCRRFRSQAEGLYKQGHRRRPGRYNTEQGQI